MNLPEDLPKESSDVSPVQGEGDYEAARRYNESVESYVKDNDVEEAARAAEPTSVDEARDLLDAEREGRAHAKGEDPQIERP